MKTCQTCNCDVPRGAHRCPNCGGYSIVETRTDAPTWSEPAKFDNRCEYQSNGLRCQFPGTVSNDSASAGLPAEWKPRWYCSAHVDCHDPVQGAQIVEASFGSKTQHCHTDTVGDVQAKARAYCLSLGLDTPEKVRAHAAKLAKTAFNKSPNKDWAGNILRRVEDGEKLPHWVVHCATEVASKP